MDLFCNGSDNEPASPGQRRRDVHEFTFRAVLAGLAIGSLLCFSNMYFGLQTGWCVASRMRCGTSCSDGPLLQLVNFNQQNAPLQGDDGESAISGAGIWSVQGEPLLHANSMSLLHLKLPPTPHLTLMPSCVL